MFVKFRWIRFLNQRSFSTTHLLHVTSRVFLGGYPKSSRWISTVFLVDIQNLLGGYPQSFWYISWWISIVFSVNNQNLGGYPWHSWISTVIMVENQTFHGGYPKSFLNRYPKHLHKYTEISG